MRDTLRALALGGLLVLVGLHPAFAAKRVALVVGIDRYEALPKLEKAVNDARAVSAALRTARTITESFSRAVVPWRRVQ